MSFSPANLVGTEGQKMTACLIPIPFSIPSCWILVKGDWSRGYTVQRLYWLAKATYQWSDPPRTRVSQWRGFPFVPQQLPSRYTVWIWRSLPAGQKPWMCSLNVQVCGHALWKQSHSGHFRDNDLANFCVNWNPERFLTFAWIFSLLGKKWQGARSSVFLGYKAERLERNKRSRKGSRNQKMVWNVIS